MHTYPKKFKNLCHVKSMSGGGGGGWCGGGQKHQEEKKINDFLCPLILLILDFFLVFYFNFKLISFLV